MNLNEIISNINTLYRMKFENFHGLILFGSAARGEMREDSDIDVVLLFNTPINSELKFAAYELINDFMIEHDLIIDCKVYHLDELKLQDTPFRKAVMTEGKLYAA